ncbi:MAG TPA: hypothetical protein VG738_18505 [Chitinophagaceae bacterium]|nr:hypothetical protein [Chitinophagaceae bacterium]
MEETNDNLSPQESIRLIESMINQVKNSFGEDGHLYILWGWLILLCSIVEFILYNFLHYEKHYIVWSVSWVAFAYQLYYFASSRKKRRVRTYTGYIIGYVWLTYVVLLFLIGYLIGRIANDTYFYHIFPILLALYGMPLFLSGIIIRFRPLVVGAVSCWVLSVITTFLPYQYQMLSLSAAMVVGWLIPGYLMRAKFKAGLHS